MTKDDTIKKYGKQDGNDEARWNEAVNMSGLTDRAVSECFISLVNLENKGLISLKGVK